MPDVKSSHDNLDRYGVCTKVIVAGSRRIEDPTSIATAITASQFPISEIVSGGAKGGDSLAEKWAVENTVPITVFKPDWSTYGRGAGPVRNGEMADYADALIAIWDGTSKGTRDMITRAEKAGLMSYVFRTEVGSETGPRSLQTEG